MSDTTPFFEPLDQGLVTSRDPAMLLKGELPVCTNAWYMPNDVAIYKAKGRTKFVTNALGAAIKGLRYIEFDDTTNQILAYAGTMYYRGDMANAETSAGQTTPYSDLTAAISNVVLTTVSGTSSSTILTTTTTNGFQNIRVGWGVSSTGGLGGIPASTTVLSVVSTTSIQLSAALTANVVAATDTVTFTATVGSGTTMEAVQYNNKHYLFNGLQNYVFESVASTATAAASLTMRPHGLAAVTEAATVATATGGHWNVALGVGYWHFVTTEVIYPGTKDEVESTNTVPSGKIPSVQIVAADINTKRVNVTRPTAITNPNATHWRVYGAVNKDAPTPPPLSSFQLMGQQDIGGTICTVGDVTLLASKTCGTAADASGKWANPTLAQGTANNQWTSTNQSGAQLTCSNFATGALSGTMSGIEVSVRMSFVNPALSGTKNVSVDVFLTYNTGGSAGTTVTKSQSVSTGKASASVQTLTFGANSDTWGRDPASWVTGDINTTDFGCKIAVNRIGDSSMTTCLIDSVEIRIYTTATTSTIISYGTYFPVVAVSVGGITSIIGSHGPPPVATTGDIFDDQLVMNDVSDDSIIRYSLAGQPEYVPSVYFVNFETKNTDSVVNIGRVGNVILVGLKNSIYRINYLPRESDAEFDRGRCYEPLSEGFGIVGTHSATNVTLPGGNIVRAFVSYNGVHITDGFSIQTWSDDIDWYGTMSVPANASSVDYLANCILVDYPVNYQLWLFYTPSGSTVNTRALVFHYHPSHVKVGNKPKISGPITVNAGAATLGRISNMPVLLTGGDTGGALGKICIEDRGYVDNSLTATANVSGFSVTTREMYLNGIGRAFTVNTAFVRCRPDTVSTVSVTPRTRFIGSAQATVTAKTFTTTNGGTPEVPFSVNASSIDYTFAESGDTGQRIRLIGISTEVWSEGLAERRS